MKDIEQKDLSLDQKPDENVIGSESCEPQEQSPEIVLTQLKVALAVENVSISFDGVKAVDDCSFELLENSITGLIGANGAGKTTMFNLISGLITPEKGRIIYKNKNITKKAVHKRARMGIGRLFQDVRGFSKMSALENVMVAFKNQKGEKFFQSIFFPLYGWRQQRELKKKAIELLSLVHLEEKRDYLEKALSYGQQKLLAIVRLLAFDSEIILLDEPTSGVNPTTVEEINVFIQKLVKEYGKTVFLIDHNLDNVMNLCDKIIVMDKGKVIAVDTPKKIQSFLEKKRSD
jgi:ABC-type branched-subunit amino acid transport system ATPase component